jgi:membrane-bound serine protease (ClpP class)
MIIGFLLNPFVNSLLILMIFGGIYFELKIPGIGLPTLIAIIGAVLYFAPLYLDGLAANWEILLFFIGLVLLALEIFVIPGFGITGILGILCVFFGLTLSLINNDLFHFPNGVMETIGYALFRVTITLIIGIGLAAAFGGSIFSFPMFNKMVLVNDQKSNEGYSIQQSEQLNVIGKEGIVIADCRPSGKVEIDGNIYDAISDAEYFLKGTKIVVTKVQGYSVRIKKI